MSRLKTLVFLVTVVFASCSSTSHFTSNKSDMTPYNYGFAEAKTGTERYEALLRTHQEAIIAGVHVDYSGIDTIRIEIPAKPTKIPLTQYNDFKGCVFIVKNTAKDCWLFGIHEKESPITVTSQMIDLCNFRIHDVLKQGRYLLIIEDEKPWVQKRRGHDYGHQRKDILLVENGLIKNAVVMPYNNEYSMPKCKYVKVKDEPLVIKNLTIKRDSESNKVTNIATISGFNNVQISNIAIYTPESNLANDRGIRINNCTNVTLEDVRIDGTYSQPDHSGYGVNMNNVWNFKAVRMYGKANWGVFGNNNINTATIEDSQLNRFDIHCYGKNVTFKNDTFFDLYNQFSSVYGEISFTNCTFKNFIPVLIESSYNSYVGFDLKMKDCVFNASPQKNYIVNVGQLTKEMNSRLELAKKCWPNVSIDNLTVNMAEGVKEFGIFRNRTIGEGATVDYISEIRVKGLSIIPHPSTTVQRVFLSSSKIVTSRPVEFEIRNSGIMKTTPTGRSFDISDDAVLEHNMPILNGRAKMVNVKNILQSRE